MCCSTPKCKVSECTALADDMPPGSWAYCAQDWQNPDYDRDDESLFGVREAFHAPPDPRRRRRA
jgi:hypothetical protein